jgi:glycosyltransferase involved in cell wall biosynthesis
MSEAVNIEASVSVVIPVYNGADHIVDAVNGVLTQGSVLREVIVLDNASTDDTVEKMRRLEDPRIRLEQQVSLVPAWQNWSDVCALADAPFVKLLCADDRLLSDALADQARVLIDHPGVGAVASRRRVITNEGRVLAKANGASTNGPIPWRDVLTETLLSGGNQVGEPACVLFRAEVLRAALPWSDSWAYLIDLELYARALHDQEFMALSAVHADFRLARGSWSSVLRDSQAREFTDFARDACHRGYVNLTRLELDEVERQAQRRARKRRLAYTAADLLDRWPGSLLPKRFRA